MRLWFAAALTALVSLPSGPALADVLIDNVNGLTVGKDGQIDTFAAILIGEDGRIEQVFERRDKKPAKVEYRLDGKGRTLIPGIIDSHVHVMELGFALLRAKSAYESDPTGDPRPEDRDLAFLAAQQLLLSSGVTTAVDMGASIEEWQTYRRAGDNDALRVRIVAYADNVRDMALIAGPGPTPWLYQDRLKANGLSLVLDGVLETREAWLKSPYANSGDVGNNARMTEIQLRNLVSRAAIDSFQVAVTAHGDAATGAVLDAIDEVAPTYGGDRRWRIEALSVLDDADLARMGANGVIASIQPGRMLRHQRVAAPLLGPQRTASLDRWRAIAQSGASIAFGSGANAEAPQPFVDMAIAMTRRTGSEAGPGNWQAAETLTRSEALHAYTTGSARAIFAEGRLGRIAPGFRADFLLIDRDPMLADPDALRNVRVLQTWVGGQLAYDAEAVSSDGIDAGKAAIDSFRAR